MYEHKKQPLAPPHVYRKRLLRNALYMLGILSLSLLIGVIGYQYTWGYAWDDALLNASMILGGMGPVDAHSSMGGPQVEGKIFASFYAIYCGIALLTSIGVLFTPVLHRLYHSLHIDNED